MRWTIFATIFSVMCAHSAFASHTHPPRPSRIPAPAYAALTSIKAQTLIPSVRQERFSTRAQTLCLALVMYHEARGSTATEQIAVAQVIYNRIEKTHATVCGTVWADRGSQFQWVKRGARAVVPREIPVWQDLQTIAIDFARHRPADITKGATFFYNPTICSPAWARSGHVTARLKHVYVKMAS